MPTVLRYRSYRVFFFSNETAEPPHVHVDSGDGYARRILNLHKADILELWHEHRARQNQ